LLSSADLRGCFTDQRLSLATLISHTYTASAALKFVDAKIGEFESAVTYPEKPKDIEWVKLKLNAMVLADQYVRVEWNNVAKIFGLDGEEKVDFNRGMGLRMTSIDAWVLQ